MKFFAASLSTETNTFAAAPTGRGSFEEYGIYRGDASVKAPEGGGALLRCLRDAAEAEGHTLVESVAAFAQPSGRTVRAVYEDLREQILDDLRAALPVHVVHREGRHAARKVRAFLDLAIERLRGNPALV